MTSHNAKPHTFLWFLVPLIVDSATLGILARLIKSGLLIATWSDWRICLLVVIAILFLTALCMRQFPKARFITARVCVIPWVIYGFLATLNMFIDWQIYWPPLDWFKHAAITSVFAPAILYLGYVIYNA